MDLDYTAGYQMKDDQFPFLDNFDNVLYMDSKGQYSEGHSAAPAQHLVMVPASPSSVFIQDYQSGDSAFEVSVIQQTPQQHNAPLQTVNLPINLVEAEMQICTLNSPVSGSIREIQRTEDSSLIEVAVPEESLSGNSSPSPVQMCLHESQESVEEQKSVSSPMSGEQQQLTPTNVSPKSSPRRHEATVIIKEKKEHHQKKKIKIDKSERDREKEKEDKEQGKNHVKLQRGGKNRLKWTQELIDLFHKAVQKLGSGAVPSAILEEMNVKGLTRENVASHLQKYRLQNKKLPRKDTTDDILYPEEKEQLKSMTVMDYLAHGHPAMHPHHLHHLGMHPHPAIPYGFPPGDGPFHPGHHRPVAHHPGSPGMYHGPPLSHHLQRRFSGPPAVLMHPPRSSSPTMNSPGPSNGSPPFSGPSSPRSPPPPTQPQTQGGFPHHHHSQQQQQQQLMCYCCTRRFSLPGHSEDTRFASISKFAEHQQQQHQQQQQQQHQQQQLQQQQQQQLQQQPQN